MSNVPGEKKMSFKDAVEKMAESELSAADEAVLDGVEPDPDDEEGGEAGSGTPAEGGEAGPGTPADDGVSIPPWVVVPGGKFRLPQKPVVYVLLRAQWTDTPARGDRHCIMWNLTDADEKWALKRTRGDSTRMLAELTKQMIRAIDGQPVDWTLGHSSNIERWWNEIGAKCRQQLQGLYHKNHNLDADERRDFFVNCVAFRNGGGGTPGAAP